MTKEYHILVLLAIAVVLAFFRAGKTGARDVLHFVRFKGILV